MRAKAFTLVEIMVSMVVLTLLVIIVGGIVSTASTITTLGNKRMDADSQVRPVFDRMASDFAQMVKRTDVDYYVKGPLDRKRGRMPYKALMITWHFFAIPPATIRQPALRVHFRCWPTALITTILLLLTTEWNDLEKVWSGTVFRQQTSPLSLESRLSPIIGRRPPITLRPIQIQIMN